MCSLITASLEISANLPKLLLLKFLLSTYYHSHFLAANLDFITFSAWSILHGATQLGWLFLSKYHFFL